jgi:hypothetical protein
LDVYKNGNKFFEDVAYRTSRPIMFIPADKPMAIGLAPGNTNSAQDTLRNINYTFLNGKHYIVTAQGIAGNPTTPLSLNIYDLGREKALDSSKVEVAVLNGVPDAQQMELKESGNSLIQANLGYNQMHPYTALSPGHYFLNALLQTTSGQFVYTYSAQWTALQGQALVLFSSGNLAGSPDFGLFAAYSNGDVLPLSLVSRTKEAFTEARLSPNPVKDQLMLTYDTEIAGPVTYKISRLDGGILETGTLTGMREFRFETGYLSPGFYQLSLYNSIGMTALKFVVVE